MATHRPAFGRPITANILTQGETAQPGNTPAALSKLIATSGNPPATLSKPIATPGEALAKLSKPLATHGNAFASGGKGVAITGEAFAGWGFDVRWVRFPKHIPLFSTVYQLESVCSWNSCNWVQRWLRELVVETTVQSVSRYVRSPGRLGSHRD